MTATTDSIQRLCIKTVNILRADACSECKFRTSGNAYGTCFDWQSLMVENHEL